MIDYATWCAIRNDFSNHLGARQVARDLGLNVKTVRRWRARPYAPRAATPRASKLDPFKGRIVGWIDAHPVSAQQVFQRLCEAGYDGGVRLVKDYVRRIRPRPREAFLTLAFAPGEPTSLPPRSCRPSPPSIRRCGCGWRPWPMSGCIAKPSVGRWICGPRSAPTCSRSIPAATMSLVLMRRQDVLALDLPPADLSLYAIPGEEGDSHDHR